MRSVTSVRSPLASLLLRLFQSMREAMLIQKVEESATKTIVVDGSLQRDAYDVTDDGSTLISGRTASLATSVPSNRHIRMFHFLNQIWK